MIWLWLDRSIIRRCSTARQRYFSSSGWRQAGEALIAETNAAKNRIKKVTPAVEELGQPLSAAKQFTVQLSHDVVKRFLRWCTTDLLFFVRLSRCSFSLELRIVRRAQSYYLAARPFPVHCFNYPVAWLIALCASFSVPCQSILLIRLFFLLPRLDLFFRRFYVWYARCTRSSLFK